MNGIRQELLKAFVRFRKMGVCRVRRWAGELSVMFEPILFEICVRFDDGGYVSKAQLLDQAVLEGAVGSLNPAFGLRGFGANHLDVETSAGTSKLRAQARVNCVVVVSPFWFSLFTRKML